MSQKRIDELYDKWETEYQKRAALIQELEALCVSWAKANREVAIELFILAIIVGIAAALATN